MTKLLFSYSWIYDQSIYSWLKEDWRDEYVTEGLKYAKEIQKRWNKINNKIFADFEALGFKLLPIWQAYPVTCKKVISFSDPLTFKVSYNWDYVFADLIHELTHVEFIYPENKSLKNKTFGYIKKTFIKEDPQTRAHLSIILVQLYVMAKVFSQKYEKMLSRQKLFLGLKRAWEIIEKNKERIDLSQPIESILKLRPK